MLGFRSLVVMYIQQNFRVMTFKLIRSVEVQFRKGLSYAFSIGIFEYFVLVLRHAVTGHPRASS